MDARQVTGTGTAHRVVILGAGHAGMSAAVQRLTELSIPELLQGTRARFVRGWATAVDEQAQAKTVRIDDDRVLRYDTLVYGQREVTERFFAGTAGGDVNALMELLSPDVTLWTDGSGKARQALRPVVGAGTVAGWFAAIGTVTCQGIEPADMKAELVQINGGSGIVFRGPERVVATVTFDVDADGRITAPHNVANPDRLQAVTDGTAYDSGIR